MAAFTSEDEAELECIFSPDDTDVGTLDTCKPSKVKTNTSFTVKELISVLNRISSSKIRSEADFAAKILANTLEKEYLKPLYCFVSSLVEAFKQCSDRASKVKSENLALSNWRKSFDKTTALYISWKQLVANTCSDFKVEESLIGAVYQHILQYFLSFVALKFSVTDSSSDITGIGVQGKTGGVDEAEKQAIRHHAGWAVKRARDGILSASAPF